MGTDIKTGMAGTGLAIATLSLSSCSIDIAKLQQAQRCNGLFSYERQLKPDPEIEKQFYKVSKQFAGSGIYFVDYFKTLGKKHCGRPALDYVLYLKGYLRGQPEIDFQSMVDSVGTAIHETAHHYSSRALQYDPLRDKRRPYGHGYTSFYTKAMGLRHLYHTRTFPAKEIHQVIKDKQVLKNSRYKAYIGEASYYHVTQQFGIYGLLDEFHAYYYSLITKNNILKQLDKKQREVSQGGNSYTMLGINDIDLSFLEFKLFILSYFRTAERHYPKVYKQLTQNHELLDVMLRLYDEFHEAYQESEALAKKQKLYDAFERERAILLGELALTPYQETLQKLRHIRVNLAEK